MPEFTKSVYSDFTSNDYILRAAVRNSVGTTMQVACAVVDGRLMWDYFYDNGYTTDRYKGFGSAAIALSHLSITHTDQGHTLIEDSVRAVYRTRRTIKYYDLYELEELKITNE
jgi:hypothetical protein